MKKLIFTILILLATSNMVFSQAKKGDTEMFFNGSFYSMVGIENYSNINITAMLNYGYYITDNLQLGVGPSVTYTYSEQKYMSYYFNPITYEYSEKEVSQVNEKTDLSASFFGNYYFNIQSKLVPYASVQYFQQTFDIPDDADFTDYGYINIGVGAKYFINQNVAYNFLINYGFSLNSDSEGGILLMQTGLSVIL